MGLLALFEIAISLGIGILISLISLLFHNPHLLWTIWVVALVTLPICMFYNRFKSFNRNCSSGEYVYLKYKDFKIFYEINPERFIIGPWNPDLGTSWDWEWKWNRIKIIVKTEISYRYPIQIKFHPWSFLQYIIDFQIRGGIIKKQKNKYLAKQQKNELLKYILENIQNDIHEIQKKSEEELNHANAQMKNIQQNLKKGEKEIKYELSQ